MARGEGGGRPPKPTNLKVLHGDRADRVNTTEPQPATHGVEPPQWLAGEALQRWYEMAPDRIAKQVLTAWDVEAFAEFCVAVVHARDALLADPFDSAHAKRCVDMVTALGGRFGWTPSDRTKLTIGDGPRRDDDGDLLTG